jgi:hypothetical protein
MLFWSWYQKCLKMFNYDISIIKSTMSIKYLCPHDLMSKIIFRVANIIKKYFYDKTNWFFIEKTIK